MCLIVRSAPFHQRLEVHLATNDDDRTRCCHHDRADPCAGPRARRRRGPAGRTDDHEGGVERLGEETVGPGAPDQGEDDGHARGHLRRHLRGCLERGSAAPLGGSWLMRPTGAHRRIDPDHVQELEHAAARSGLPGRIGGHTSGCGPATGCCDDPTARRTHPARLTLCGAGVRCSGTPVRRVVSASRAVRSVCVETWWPGTPADNARRAARATQRITEPAGKSGNSSTSRMVSSINSSWTPTAVGCEAGIDVMAGRPVAAGHRYRCPRAVRASPGGGRRSGRTGARCPPQGAPAERCSTAPFV